MTEWSYQPYDCEVAYRPSLPRKIFVRTAPALAAFSFSALVALRLAGGLAEEAYAHAPAQEATLTPAQEATLTPVQGAPQAPALELRLRAPEQELAQAPALEPQASPQGAPQAKLQAKAQKIAAKHGANPYGALFDPDGSMVGVPALMAESAPIGPAFSPLQGEPLFVLMDTVEPAQQVAEAEPAPPTESVAQQAEKPTPLAEKTASPAESAAATLALVTPPPRPDLTLKAPDLTVKAPEQVAEAELPGAPVPPVRPSDLTAPARAVEVAPPTVPENATPRRDPRASARASRQALASTQASTQASTMAQNGQGNFFDKIFGGLQEKGQQMAYASQEGSALRLSRGATSSPSPVTASGGTAVYDIAAHTVTLPSGERLEAHSGLGPYFDDPGHVHIRMRGATPPAVYDLKLRESLFHGVQALRLTPVSGSTYGRSGLLAHTFMLGQRGDSNGCVSFRNYRAFLQAYMSGQVRRLVVVGRRD